MTGFRNLEVWLTSAITVVDIKLFEEDFVSLTKKETGLARQLEANVIVVNYSSIFFCYIVYLLYVSLLNLCLCSNDTLNIKE
jgi:hypothetical protein